MPDTISGVRDIVKRKSLSSLALRLEWEEN